MATKQFEMIFQPFCSPSVAEGPTMQVGRGLPDSQVQPFDVRSVQLAGILRISPRLVPTPCRTNPGFSLHFDHAIFSSFLYDLSVQASCPEKSANDLPIELEAIGGNQWNSGCSYSSKNILKEGEGVAITSLANNSRRPEARPDFDGGENPNRWMLIAADHCADLVGLQFTNRDLLNRLMVESTTCSSGFLQPAIHCIPGNLLGSGNRGFVQTLDTHRSDFVERSAAMLETMIDSPAVPAEGPAATFAAESFTLAPPRSVKSEPNYYPQRGLGSWNAFRIWTTETFHGSWTRSSVDLVTSKTGPTPYHMNGLHKTQQQLMTEAPPHLQNSFRP